MENSEIKEKYKLTTVVSKRKVELAKKQGYNISQLVENTLNLVLDIEDDSETLIQEKINKINAKINKIQLETEPLQKQLKNNRKKLKTPIQEWININIITTPKGKLGRDELHWTLEDYGIKVDLSDNKFAREVTRMLQIHAKNRNLKITNIWKDGKTIRGWKGVTIKRTDL
jgi:hypothetical protein